MPVCRIITAHPTLCQAIYSEGWLDRLTTKEPYTFFQMTHFLKNEKSFQSGKNIVSRAVCLRGKMTNWLAQLRQRKINWVTQVEIWKTALQRDVRRTVRRGKVGLPFSWLYPWIFNHHDFRKSDSLYKDAAIVKDGIYISEGRNIYPRLVLRQAIYTLERHDRLTLKEPITFPNDAFPELEKKFAKG